MNTTRFGFETPPPDAGGERQQEGDARPAIRAAPEKEDEDQRGEEPAEEPGYGHGV